MSLIGTDVGYAKSILEKDGLIGMPTETVYGLAGNALSEEAILKIFKAKDRPAFDPLIAHIGRKEDVFQLTQDIPDIASKLIDSFWPGPLTLLLPKKPHIPDLLTSGLDRIAIRMPRHDLALELLRSLAFPLAAPSANPFGYISPTTAQHVADQLGEKVNYILDGGQTKIGIESTIVAIENQTIVIYRTGGMSLESLEKLGRVKLQLNMSSNPVAPGMLKSHYAPKTPFILDNIANWISQHSTAKVGVISFKEHYEQASHCITLSPRGNLDEAARGLFAAMRKLDSLQLDMIISEKFPENGLGIAINDRLKRAAAR